MRGVPEGLRVAVVQLYEALHVRLYEGGSARGSVRAAVRGSVHMSAGT